MRTVPPRLQNKSRMGLFYSWFQQINESKQCQFIEHSTKEV